MRPAVFLDRDGVLTKEEGYVTSLKSLHIFSYAADCIGRLHNAGFYCICVSNQSAVARGMISREELEKMNIYLKMKIRLDAVYYCPHLPSSDGGIISEFAIECNCRKPQIGLIKEACRGFDIDLTRSWMIGDRWSDMEMGHNADIKNILIQSDLTDEQTVSERMYVLRVERLDEAVNYILDSTIKT